MKSIVLVGHSMGGQMLARYAAIGNKLDTSARLVYWIGNLVTFSRNSLLYSPIFFVRVINRLDVRYRCLSDRDWSFTHYTRLHE